VTASFPEKVEPWGKRQNQTCDERFASERDEHSPQTGTDEKKKKRTGTGMMVEVPRAGGEIVPTDRVLGRMRVCLCVSVCGSIKGFLPVLRCQNVRKPRAVWSWLERQR
jgi:hypothetical protein